MYGAPDAAGPEPEVAAVGGLEPDCARIREKLEARTSRRGVKLFIIDKEDRK